MSSLNNIPRFLKATKASAARGNSRHKDPKDPNNVENVVSQRRASPSAIKFAPAKRSNSVPSHSRKPIGSTSSNPPTLRNSNILNKKLDGDADKQTKPTGSLKSHRISNDSAPASVSSKLDVAKSKVSERNSPCNSSEKVVQSDSHVPAIKPTVKRAESARVLKRPPMLLNPSRAVNSARHILHENASNRQKVDTGRARTVSASSQSKSSNNESSNAEKKDCGKKVKVSSKESCERKEKESKSVAGSTKISAAGDNESTSSSKAPSKTESNVNHAKEEKENEGESSAPASKQSSSDSRKAWSLQDFEIGKPLGRGRFGQVYQAREKTTKFIVAVKVLWKKDLESAKITQQVKREIQVQSHLKHPHILKLYSYFQDQERIYIVLEYAHWGELYKFLKQQGTFTVAQTAKYIYQLASALHHLQLKNIIHRDLKPENLLLDSRLDLKLADFGWSVHSPDLPRSTLCGTPDYLSPEMLMGQSYSAAVDIWSMGALCYEFLFGKPPFETPTIEETYKRIKAVDIRWPETISEDAKRFIGGMLKLEPEQRTALSEILTDPWILANYTPPQSSTT